MTRLYTITHINEQGTPTSLVKSMESGNLLHFRVRDSEAPPGVRGVVVLPSEGQGVKNLLLAGVQEWLGSGGGPVARVRSTTYGAEYAPIEGGRGVMDVMVQLSVERGAAISGPDRWEGHVVAVAWNGSRGLRCWMSQDGVLYWHEVRELPGRREVQFVSGPHGASGSGRDAEFTEAFLGLSQLPVAGAAES